MTARLHEESPRPPSSRAAASPVVASPHRTRRAEEATSHSNRFRALIQRVRDRSRRAPGAPALTVADPLEVTLDGPPPASPRTRRSGEGRLAQGRPAAAQARWTDPYQPGTVLAGRYQLVEQLGEGGMGAVWRACSMSLDLDVAVKVIRRDACVPDAGDRLLKEARATARVIHPAAVRVFDFNVTDAGDPFLVMELLAGKTLSRVLAEEGPLSPLSAVQLVLPLLDALCVAHREGIVHRDVKPANVMIVEQGRRVAPKLIDFGIAGITPNAWSRKLAPYGVLLGSPIYMAPEQASRSPVIDARTDVWGACTLLYELVSGRRPFRGFDRTSVIREILSSSPPRPAALADDAQLWAIVERGLAKALEDRWPTMDALGGALAAWAIARGATCDATGASLTATWSVAARRE